MSATDADDDDDDINFGASTPLLDSISMHASLTSYLLLASTVLSSDIFSKGKGRPRNASLFDQRLNWENFCAKHGSRAGFKRHIRMTEEAFNELLSCIKSDLVVNSDMAHLRGGEILPELCLYCCLRYLAGGSYSDIMYFIGISAASVYRVIWKTIDAINRSDKLSIKFPQTVDEVAAAANGFKSRSSNQCIQNCVSVIDGYHLGIQTPSKKEVKNVRSFFSGHYQTYGVNVQAACDHNCCFTFIGVAGPGVMGDRDAVKMIRLSELIERLPGLYCVIGDCAYTATEHLVPIYRGESAKTSARMDNFNFFASQLRIRIEMAFGLMVNKWGILTRPLSIKVRKVKKLIIAIARLHNFCINFQLRQQEQQHSNNQQQRRNRGRSQEQRQEYNPSSSTTDELSSYENYLRESTASSEFNEMVQAQEQGWSKLRDMMAREVEALGLTRPLGNRRVNRSRQDNNEEKEDM
jgi:hypothetical protein